MYVNKSEIQEKVLEKIAGKWNTEQHFIGFSDDEYYLPTKNEFRTYIKYNKISISPADSIAQTEGFDCDDYAFILKGQISLFNRDVAHKKHSWAVGIIWGEFDWVNELHATNWIVTRDSGLFLFEPQFYVDGFLDFDKLKGNVQLIIL